MDTDGRIAIGETTFSNSMQVRLRCNNNTGCTGSSRYGLDARTTGASTNNYGIRGYATGTSGSTNVGIYASGTNASSNNRGIWGHASGSNAYAGYFTGDTYATGSYLGSDERFKYDVRALDGADMLHRLLQVQPRQYQIFNEQELQQAGMPTFSSKDGPHLGVIAQELELAFPELVIDKVSYLSVDGDITEESETVITKAVNYNGLAIAMLAAIQHQQEVIVDLLTRIETLENQ